MAPRAHRPGSTRAALALRQAHWRWQRLSGVLQSHGQNATMHLSRDFSRSSRAWILAFCPVVSRGVPIGKHRGIVMEVACLDLEGVLVPEIWIAVAQRTGIDALRATTRDVPDYDDLMRQRLSLLHRHGLGIDAIRAVIAPLDPFPGAAEFLDWLRERFQVVVLSDTFYEFATPLMRKLGWPTLFCNHLDIGEGGKIVGYRLRQPDQKRQAVKALRALNFRTIAAGDSYNDTNMMAEADAGIFFRPPQDIAQQFPQYPVTQTYEEMREAFRRTSARLLP